MQTYYVIDAGGRLVEAGGDWDSFALSNDGAAAVVNRIIGRSLWDQVQGLETRAFLNAVFFWSRVEQETFETTYRCDSPHESRLFRMVVEPVETTHLRVSHKLIASDVVTRPAVVLLEDRVDTERCSMCCSIRIGRSWVDPFAYPERRYFPANHTLCPSCKDDARSRIRGARVLSFAKMRAAR